ncbi:unnamed protein product [Rotaria sp. Silwood1]|nr:unnamed protein product [Rotaria sp. Silwood1]CAF1588627.1 unnamed protein product [Rotaria sp. Silwood1]
MSMYTHDSVLRRKIKQTIIITIFDSILNEQLRKLFNGFKPLAVYKAQLLIEKELIIIKLLDIVNELRRLKIISQSLPNITTPEAQAIFLIYMMIKLIEKEFYIDEINIKQILKMKNLILFINIFYYLNKDILKNQSSEYKTVIQKQFLINILDRKQLTNIQFELALNQNMRQCQVIQTNILTDQRKNTKIVKEKKLFSKPTQILSRLTYNSFVKQHKFLIETNQGLLIIDKNINNELLLNLRSLRHNYIQTKIPRNQLHLLVEQDDWNNDIYPEFKHELNIIDSNNSLDLIRHITYNISLLIKENDSISGKP